MFHLKKIQKLQEEVASLSSRMDVFKETYNGNIKLAQERLDSIEKDVLLIKSAIEPAMKSLISIVLGLFEGNEGEDEEGENEGQQAKEEKRPTCPKCKKNMVKAGFNAQGKRVRRCKECKGSKVLS